MNSSANSYGTILDLVFSSLLNYSLIACNDPILPADAYHPPLIFTIHNIINDKVKLFSNQHFFNYNFEKANINEICNMLADIEWNLVLDTPNIDDDVSVFYDKINLAIELFVPLKRVRNDNYPPWFTHQLKRLIFYKKIAHRNFKVSNNYQDYLVFSKLRADCKELARVAHFNFITKVENNLISKPKQFWSYMNSLKRDTLIPGEVKYNNVSANTSNEIANLFADYFSSVHTLSSGDVPVFHYDNNLTININTITKEMIAMKLKNLKVNKGAGPDHIPPALLKSCSSVLIEPLFILFNRSLQCGVFPHVWKRGIIVPVYEDYDKKM